jgi:hypothetical protein
MSEDIPDHVGEHLPGIEHVVDLSLEPIDAPSAGQTAIWKVARTIAKADQISAVPARFAIPPGQQIRTIADFAGRDASDESLYAYPAVFPFAQQPT